MRKNIRSVKGNRHIKSALFEAVWVVSRSRNNSLALTSL
ncbi:hypothetical protein [Bacillus sp. AFS014408]